MVAQYSTLTSPGPRSGAGGETEQTKNLILTPCPEPERLIMYYSHTESEDRDQCWGETGHVRTNGRLRWKDLVTKMRQRKTKKGFLVRYSERETNNSR